MISYHNYINVYWRKLAQTAPHLPGYLFLQAEPPLEVTDLIEELRDGHVLLSLLEVLLGTTLVSLFIVNASMHV